MAKKIKTVLKLQIEAGKANPAPPIGPALGQHGVNIQEFCSKFNEATKDMTGDIVPAEITIYEDRSFTFKLKTPPASDLLRKAARPIGEALASLDASRSGHPDGAAGIEKGSGVPNKQKVGKITREDLRRIAERKMEDLNANDINAAEKIIAGTARSMGIEVEE